MSELKFIQVAQVRPNRLRSSVIHWHYSIIALSVGIFIFMCMKLDLTQDDAYISFRYAANYLSGHGLVFNYGERVEGYTNFLWVMLLALFKGVFGVDFMLFSRTAGVLSGSLIFYLLYVLLKQHFEKIPLLLHLSVALMLLSNLSLPYWSIASLETSAFACMVLAALVAEYRRPQLTPALLIIATLLRPEGVIVFGVILLDRIIKNRKIPWQYILIYLIPLFPFAIFKLIYFGSLFPNPFYAKSGMGFEYIQSGLEYLWHFTMTIGVYGVVFLVPFLAVKKLWSKYSLLYLYVLLYTVYIVWVGGDVLKVYRFFVPVVPVLYFLFVVSLGELISLIKFERQSIYGLVFLSIACFANASFYLSYEFIWKSRNSERTLIEKMNVVSIMLKSYMGSSFSLATSTIGIAGYHLLGHRVIDMLGLTDTSIARNPEKVKGIVSSWKERRFNNQYLLKQQPDFILFSTGYKPSAPGEKALMLHSEFRNNYSFIGVDYGKGYVTVWQRTGTLNLPGDVVHPDIEFVNKLADGINLMNYASLDSAFADFQESQRRLGEEYAVLSYLTGDCFARMKRIDSATVYFRKALVKDTICWGARSYLIDIAERIGDTATSNSQKKYVRRHFPWNKIY